LFLLDELPFIFWFKSWCYLLLVSDKDWIIWSWARFFILFSLLTSSFSWTELASISSLNLINQLVLHSVSRLIWTWTWNHYIRVYYRRTSQFISLWLNLFIMLYLFTKVKSNIVTSWANIFRFHHLSLALSKSFTATKACGSFTSFSSRNLRHL
jgi:hypothetical protein